MIEMTYTLILRWPGKGNKHLIFQSFMSYIDDFLPMGSIRLFFWFEVLTPKELPDNKLVDSIFWSHEFMLR